MWEQNESGMRFQLPRSVVIANPEIGEANQNKKRIKRLCIMPVKSAVRLGSGLFSVGRFLPPGKN